MTDQQEYTKFSVHYGAAEGSDIDNHKMNAYDLGMSIVEFAKMVNRADDIINRESTLELEVTAPAKAGSLVIEFALLIKSSGALEVMKYLGISAASATVVGGTALGIARRLKDKRILNINTVAGSGQSTIVLEDEQVVVDTTVARLVSDPVIRKAMNEVITQPLNDERAPSFQIEIEGMNEPVFSVEGDEVQEFTPLPRASLSDEKVETKITNVILNQINFDSNRGWKMVYDGKECSVKMEDEGFMARVRDSEKSFTKGDMFEVSLSIITKTTARSQRTEYVISRVVRHRVTADRKIL
ncbi:hypothetical protein [Erwinia persicina]|uniref:Uncharacterized protein n=1 Tax=Erwinia persicina TaxID=55211 RepID=A0A4U3FL00_9GAMM|nr:hypothetical protein [Erwinia persicina]TKJ94808.1 hypothetical protein EpCFBP13511_00125 [Erwinia persicina]